MQTSTAGRLLEGGEPLAQLDDGGAGACKRGSIGTSGASWLGSTAGAVSIGANRASFGGTHRPCEAADADEHEALRDGQGMPSGMRTLHARARRATRCHRRIASS